MSGLTLTSGFVVIALFAATAAAQRPRTAPSPPPTGSASSTLGVQVPMPTELQFEIREQPDSPLRLVKMRQEQGRLLPGSPILVRNDGAGTISAFVLRVDVEPYGMNKVVIVGPKGLAPGQTQMHPLGMARFGDTPPTGAVSVDFVQFTDGGTWGEDSLGRSKDVAAYLKGRARALERLKTLLPGGQDAEIDRSLQVFGASSFSEPNLPTGRPRREVDFDARGYEEIVNILRRMPRNTDAGRDLARQLEVLEGSSGPPRLQH